MSSTTIPNFLTAIDSAYNGKFNEELKTLATPLHDKKDTLQSIVGSALDLPNSQTLSDDSDGQLLGNAFEFATKLIHQLASQPGRAELLDVSL